MVETALKQKAIDYIDALDDEQTLRVITFIEALPQKSESLQNSKTRTEQNIAKQALDEFFEMARPSKTETSNENRSEIAKAIWRKYESID